MPSNCSFLTRFSNSFFFLTGHCDFFPIQGPSAGAHFKDETDSRGLIASLNNITWSAALVDYDLDGDSDIFFFNDLGVPSPDNLDRGFVHVWKNDGTGHFEFVPPEETGMDSSSNMGHAFGDFNCDGNLDSFVTRFGSFVASSGFPPDITLEEAAQRAAISSSTFLFGSDNGTFVPGGASFGPNGKRLFLPFGWGAAAIDLEADGDQDIVYVGGLLEVDFHVGSPGVVLENLGCSGTFTRSDAFPLGNYNKFMTNGLSAGDLNNDGFDDLVVVAGRLLDAHQIVTSAVFTGAFSE